MPEAKKPDPLSRLGASIFGSAVAEVVTLPIDTCKVRLQLQHVEAGVAPRYTGMLSTAMKVASEEGVAALFKGMIPALARQCSYTPITMLLYEPVRDCMVAPGEQIALWQRLLAGGISGSIGITLMNPTEVVKTRLQANAGKPIPIGTIVRQVMKADGVAGFWAGIGPNVARCFVVNAVELGTYDHAKHTLIEQFNLDNGIVAHVGASGIAGVSSAVCSTPVDVIKTRLMAQAGQATQEYSGPLQALIEIPRKEGPMALYKGFVPMCARKVVWVTAFFVTYEKVRVMLGMPTK
jgi:hypothetical protein